MEELAERRTSHGNAANGGIADGLAGLTPLQWLICGVAALGFAFDLYETLVLPLIVRPALTALGNFKPGSPEYNLWVGTAVLSAIGFGGYLWTPGRLPDRPPGTPARSGVEHLVVCPVGLRRRPCSYLAAAVVFPLHHHHRRVCRICSWGGVGGGAFLQSQAARIRAGLHAGCFRLWEA